MLSILLALSLAYVLLCDEHIGAAADHVKMKKSSGETVSGGGGGRVSHTGGDLDTVNTGITENRGKPNEQMNIFSYLFPPGGAIAKLHLS